VPLIDWIIDAVDRAGLDRIGVDRWGAALAVAVALFLVLLLMRRLLVWRVGAALARRPFQWLEGVLDLLRRTRRWSMLVLAIYCGSLVLFVPGGVPGIITSVTIIVLLVQAALWADGLVRFSIALQVRKRAATDIGSLTTLQALGFLGRMAIWILVLLVAMANLGINVTAMVAGLGIGGVAVALAAQNILGDLFASASIVLDKPFVLGDSIDVDGKIGTVEQIGLKTTRLRALSGEELIFANNDLLKSRIHNYKRMRERRATLTLGVTYQTPVEKLESIPAIIREAIQAQPNTRFDRAHFKTYGDFALLFEAVYFVLSPEYSVYMDIQQAVNLTIFRRFAAEKIEFAYPTHTVFLQGQSP